MKKLCIVALPLIIALAGCAGEAGNIKNVTLPSGGQGFYIKCNGSSSDWTVCYEAATKACNGKYTIVDKNETIVPVGTGGVHQDNRNMMVECNN